MTVRWILILLVAPICVGTGCDDGARTEVVASEKPAANPVARERQPFAIDIKLKGQKNVVWLSAKNPLLFAALGSPSFDVTKIDVTTLRFGPARVNMLHDLEDSKQYRWHHRDLNEDGYEDLMLHVVQRETGLTLDDRKACLYGSLAGGRSFEVCDRVRMHP